MSGIVVVYELDQRAGGSVRQVHAAPHAPGTTAERGPRSMCGKDTFAMQMAAWEPSAHPDGPWYPPEHEHLVCPGCDAVMRDDD